MAKRIPVPANIKIPDLQTDERAAIANAQDIEQPEWKHSWVHKSELGNKQRLGKLNMVPATDEAGNQFTLRNSVLVRMPKVIHDAITAQGHKASRDEIGEVRAAHGVQDEQEKRNGKDLDQKPKARKPVISGKKSTSGG